MASKYGFTVEGIMNMDLADINRLNRDQMRDALQVMNSAANKRVQRLESTGNTNAFAYQRALKNVGDGDTLKFKTPKTDKTQSRNVLYKSLTNVTEFMRSQTSTVKGWKKTKSKISKSAFGETTGHENEINELLRDRDFWKFVRNLTNNYAYDSVGAISTATVYNKNYDSISKIQRALSYLTGAEVELDSVINTPVVDLWDRIFLMSGGKKDDFADRDGYADEEWLYDEEFGDIWRND